MLWYHTALFAIAALVTGWTFVSLAANRANNGFFNRALLILLAGVVLLIFYWVLGTYALDLWLKENKPVGTNPIAGSIGFALSALAVIKFNYFDRRKTR